VKNYIILLGNFYRRTRYYHATAYSAHTLVLYIGNIKKENLMKRLRILSIIVVTVVLLVGVVYIAFARGNKNSGVLPPNSSVQGLTYGEWSAIWWQYVFSLPVDQNPLDGAIGANCSFERNGNVAVVVGDPLSPEPIECEVPTGTMLYLDILSAECSSLEEPPFYGGNEEELRACAEGFVLHDLEATIDGVAIQSIERYIHTSPLFEFTVPDDNILGVEAGTGQSISNGAHLMLAPLTPGEHTIHLHGSYPDLDFTVDTNYHITVTR
jgi:hypothetical protein